MSYTAFIDIHLCTQIVKLFYKNNNNNNCCLQKIFTVKIIVHVKQTVETSQDSGSMIDQRVNGYSPRAGSQENID